MEEQCGVTVGAFDEPIIIHDSTNNTCKSDVDSGREVGTGEERRDSPDFVEFTCVVHSECPCALVYFMYGNFGVCKEFGVHVRACVYQFQARGFRARFSFYVLRHKTLVSGADSSVVPRIHARDVGGRHHRHPVFASLGVIGQEKETNCPMLGRRT